MFDRIHSALIDRFDGSFGFKTHDKDRNEKTICQFFCYLSLSLISDATPLPVWREGRNRGGKVNGSMS